MRTLLLLGAGLAAYGITRFARTAITEERNRRDHDGTKHELTRWEDEGGQVTPPRGATVAVTPASLQAVGEPAI